MSKRGSSKRWLSEHHSDRYVKEARARGYRSRAAFKLLEIQRRDRILKPGMTVVDLGAAPGGWSQVASEAVGPAGRVVALDLLPMAAIPGVTCIQGDFTDDEVERAVVDAMGGHGIDLVMSDMAPNLSGIRVRDEARSALLCELAHALAVNVLVEGGTLLVKAFHGGGSERLIKDLRDDFARVVSRKPKASRARSSEYYVLAQGFRL